MSEKTIGNFIKGLQLIYDGNMDVKYQIQAEHDIIHCGGNDITPDSDKGKLLEEYGFHEGEEGWDYFT